MELILDVRDLEPPEPLLQAISALQGLGEGDYLCFQHRMYPCRLADYLIEQGFAHHSCRGRGGECEVFIWRGGDMIAKRQVLQRTAHLQSWE